MKKAEKFIFKYAGRIVWAIFYILLCILFIYKIILDDFSSVPRIIVYLFWLISGILIGLNLALYILKMTNKVENNKNNL